MAHPLNGDVFTPMTDEIVGMLEGLYREYGRWESVSEVTGMKKKQIRAIRQGKHANGKRRKTISLRVLDRILTTTEAGHTSDYPWYTPDELVEMGIWKAMG